MDMTELDKIRTRPWAEHELATVDGLSVVYEPCRLTGTMLICLPGRRKASIRDLQLEGRVVAMPVIPRIDLVYRAEG